MRFLFIVWILAVCSGCQPGQTVLKGHIENYRGESVFVSCYESNLQDTLKVDASGNFSWTPSGTGSQEYGIRVAGYQPWRIPVYLTPGDREELDLSLLPDKTIKVKYAGNRATENEYRLAFSRLDELRIGYDLESRKLSFADYKAQLEPIEHDLQILLEQIDDPEIKAHFRQKQHLWFQNRRTVYASVLAMRLREGEATPDENFNAFVQSLDVNDPKECNEYMVYEIIYWQQAQDSAFRTEERKIDYLNRLDHLVSNQEMKNEFATKYMKMAISGELGRPLDKEIKRYNEICTDGTMRNQIAEQYKEYLRVYGNLMPGKPAPDLINRNPEGKEIKLSDLKGKVVLVDFWATWCGPCVASLPHIQELYNKYHDKGFEVFCVADNDSSEDEWKNFIAGSKVGMQNYHHILRGLKTLTDENGEFVGFDRSNDQSDKYAVHYLPTKYLIAADGTIIGKIGTDEELDSILAEIFAE